MIIKVCGLKEKENMQAIDHLQPDLLGMIFYEKSPRFLSGIEMISTKASKVGVFVNESVEIMIKTAKNWGLSYIQLHGNEKVETAALLREKGFQVIKAMSIETEINKEVLEKFSPYCTYFLFDSKGKNPGGNGIKFNWEFLSKYDLEIPFLLSGGIQPGDINSIKKLEHPSFAGVDINSGFEISPGIKNVESVKKFIDEVRTRQA